MPQVLSDPSFETGAGWSLLTDCDINGASFQSNNQRTGARSLRIQSRRQAIGPTTTCGRAETTPTTLVPGRVYVFGVWTKSSGVLPSVGSFLNIGSIGGTASAGIGWTNNSSVYQLKAGIYTADTPSALFQLVQTSGSSNVLQSRFYDDAFMEDLGTPEGVAVATQAIRAGIIAPSVLATALDQVARLRSNVGDLKLSSVVDSLGLRGRVSKP